ncbi:glycosyltransferase family 2 protein [Enterobacter roggenkampii]|uniref:Glycosyltransferase family 2 protein n=1 Tax=Enterobacter roggenkampii TaxID=1812935 RepID=A0AAX1WKP4_9ENTR|nr:MULTISPECIES: glycosyltransferase family 2 protein [Enterobacter cloacae complex]NUD86486.1 glycosyltransferase family 2 protein [Escherichia coli]EJO48829.1 glycosyl transferase family protein [Enterobacter sp. SST3]MBA7914845.1 glycosyltransferase family 2 protein [Enterobacter roggenkampii]MBY7249347.1 glycosyltransferase family 2 protein [Enterobacter roggenkampii]MCM7570430.1 glycosyltransferase family 2 protein [Enterobacter roggenkampii]
MTHQPKVTILLCTYNGQEFLKKQLDSIINQTYTHWDIYVSDDGSSDRTIEILRHYQKKLGKNRLVILDGPGQGFARNFLSLIYNHCIFSDYYAFCDQDDIWNSDKLERSLSALSSKSQTPALYCSRTELIDEQDITIGYSYNFSKAATLKNALIQSIAGGNTMLINHAARKIITKVPESILVPSHDWWIYQCVCACGGYVYYDSTSTVKYRQHSGNIVGANRLLSARILRFKLLFSGSLRPSIDKNILLLKALNGHLTEESKILIDKFNYIRTASFISRMVNAHSVGLYRQSVLESIAFYVALLLKKI